MLTITFFKYMYKKLIITSLTFIFIIISYKIYKFFQQKEDEIKILNTIIRDEVRESEGALFGNDFKELGFNKNLRDCSKQEFDSLNIEAEKYLLKKEYQVSIFDSLYGVNTSSKYYHEVGIRNGMIPENIYKKTKKIDFEKLNIRKSLKLKPYNSNNIYDKNFWGIFMFSRIMFDHTGKEALIEVRSTTKENNDKLIHLKKNENNEWTIVGRDILVTENSNYYEKYP